TTPAPAPGTPVRGSRFGRYQERRQCDLRTWWAARRTAFAQAISSTGRDPKSAWSFAAPIDSGVCGGRQLLPDGMHNAGILPHRKIQENALCCEETLHTLLGPPRQ